MLKYLIILSTFTFYACQTTQPPRLTTQQIDKKVIQTYKENFCHLTAEMFFDIQNLVDSGVNRVGASQQVLKMNMNNKNEIKMHNVALQQNNKYTGKPYINVPSLLQYGVEFERCTMALKITRTSDYRVNLDMSSEYDVNIALQTANNCFNKIDESANLYTMRHCLVGT